jgi:hypothetical protein
MAIRTLTKEELFDPEFMASVQRLRILARRGSAPYWSKWKIITMVLLLPLLFAAIERIHRVNGSNCPYNGVLLTYYRRVVQKDERFGGVPGKTKFY